MKIIEITCEPILHGGQERFISNLVDNIDDSKFHIDVLTPYKIDNVAFVHTVEKHGGQVFALGLEFSPGKSRKQLRDAIHEFLKNKGYDVAHIHSGSISALAYSAEATNKAGIKKRIVHSHCSATPSLKHSIVKVFFSRKLENNATNLLACSIVAGEDKFSSRAMTDRVQIIANGIRIEDFVRNEEKRKIMRAKLNIDEKTYVIGTVGRLSYQKNPDYLVKIFSEVHRNIPDSKLLFVGDGELKNEVVRIVEELKLNDCVIFAGNVDNANDYYQVFDIFLLPSRFEGLPFVAIEAQAAGLPCLISSGVTNDVKICNNVEMVAVDDFEKWIKIIIQSKYNNATDNTAILKDVGYDISNTIMQIEKIYYN